LEENKVGINTGVAKVPIVPSAILFDLAIGSSEIRPDKEMGYQACIDASSNPPKQGNYGVGTGATVGKIFGMGQSMKSGVGMAGIDLGGGVLISVIIAVNAFGDVIDPKSRKIIAGARTIQKGPLKLGSANIFADTLETMKSFIGKTVLSFASKQNTVIGVVVTNAILSKEGANKVAQMAQNGLALSIRPAHTMLDGDTIFVMATGKRNADVNLVGAYAAEIVSQAIVNAVISAETIGGLPSVKSLNKNN